MFIILEDPELGSDCHPGDLECRRGLAGGHFVGARKQVAVSGKQVHSPVLWVKMMREHSWYTRYGAQGTESSLYSYWKSRPRAFPGEDSVWHVKPNTRERGAGKERYCPVTEFTTRVAQQRNFWWPFKSIQKYCKIVFSKHLSGTRNWSNLATESVPNNISHIFPGWESIGLTRTGGRWACIGNSLRGPRTRMGECWEVKKRRLEPVCLRKALLGRYEDNQINLTYSFV